MSSSTERGEVRSTAHQRAALKQRPRCGRRRLASVALISLLGIIATSCSDLAPVPGAAPLRYRDEIFTSVSKTADVTYGSAVNQQGTTVSLKLDVYRPVGDTTSKRPVIIWAHGGSFNSGDKTSPEILDETNVFAKKGYVTASINYRLSPNGCTTVSAECVTAIFQATEDAQAAIRFFRKEAATYGVDPERIGIAGTSAGAIMALDAGYKSDKPGNSGNPGYSSAVRAAVSLSGAAIFNSEIGPGDAPALLFHGTADPLVQYSWAQDTVRTAQSAGLTAYLVTWQGEGHVPYAQHRSQILDLTTNFLYRTLDVKHAGT